jgi:hypothetical protein
MASRVSFSVAPAIVLRRARPVRCSDECAERALQADGFLFGRDGKS